MIYTFALSPLPPPLTQKEQARNSRVSPKLNCKPDKPRCSELEATIATGSEDSTIIIWQPAKESGGDRRKFEARKISYGFLLLLVLLLFSKFY